MVFLGNGDAHDPKYDAYGVGSTLLELRQFAAQESTYRGIPLDEDFCPFRVTIYPSDEMLAKFTSNNPIIFAVAGALIFTFTFAVFMMYDFWVERRQRLVVRTAQHSNAIVSSLFPSNVRDRAFGTAEENHEKDKAKPVPTFLNNGLAKLRKNGEPEGPSVEEDASLPVADLFPECTVFFCDLVGFTSWSANRTPTEVFILLESIYGVSFGSRCSLPSLPSFTLPLIIHVFLTCMVFLCGFRLSIKLPTVEMFSKWRQSG